MKRLSPRLSQFVQRRQNRPARQTLLLPFPGKGYDRSGEEKCAQAQRQTEEGPEPGSQAPMTAAGLSSQTGFCATATR